MSRLTMYHQQDVNRCLLTTQDVAVITAQLAAVGVRFERWSAHCPIHADMTTAEILAAYAKDIQRLQNEGGYQTVDAISLSADHPDKAMLRQKFLNEHTHGEDEVRFFVRGSGLFCLHIGEQVLQVQCCEQDLIAVPALTPHWFDMGPEPNFTAIRWFNHPDGWVAKFTGSDIALRFPLYS